MKKIKLYLNIVVFFSITIFCLSSCGYDNMKTYDFKVDKKEYLIDAESYQIYNSDYPFDDRSPDEMFDVDRNIVFNVLKTQQEASFDLLYGQSFSVSVIRESGSDSNHLLKVKRIK